MKAIFGERRFCVVKEKTGLMFNHNKEVEQVLEIWQSSRHKT